MEATYTIETAPYTNLSTAEIDLESDEDETDGDN